MKEELRQNLTKSVLPDPDAQADELIRQITEFKSEGFKKNCISLRCISRMPKCRFSSEKETSRNCPLCSKIFLKHRLFFGWCG